VSIGEFRADLYYRLAVLPVEIPPLRQHRDDLPFLIDILLSRINGDREPSLSLSAGCRKRLMDYDFPGNIRELVNIFERLAVLADDEAQEHHLPAELLEPSRPQERLKPSAVEDESEDYQERNLKLQVQHFERQVILRAVHLCGSKRKAALHLGIDIGTLIRKLQRD
jgi:DNA-binding NtrC family response regulator